MAKQESIAATVTVVIPTYRRNKTALIAIESAERQGKSVVEILVVDDNDQRSVSDELQNLLKKREFKRVKYIKNSGPHGGSAARNLGIVEAKGTFIAFLDDDDRWLPQKIEKQLRAIETQQAIGAFCGYIEQDTIFNEETKVSETKQVITSKDLIAGACPTSTSLAMVKTEVLKEVGGFDSEIKSFEDYDLWLKCSKHGVFANLSECLAVYVQHRGTRLSVDYMKRMDGYRALQSKWQNNTEIYNLLKTSEAYHKSTACIANAKAQLGQSYFTAVVWSCKAVASKKGNLRAWQWLAMTIMGFRISTLVRGATRSALGKQVTRISPVDSSR